jgi:nicotinate-nucleotide--dimethylbenzimidazole phosphoribosyltransferase
MPAWRTTFGSRAGLLDAKVGAGGTASYLTGPAMSPDAMRGQRCSAVPLIVRDLAATGCNTLGFGEMGIGNTASASLLTHCLTGLPLADVIGRGTGLDDAGLEKKRALLAQALAHWPERNDAPLDVLARFGGFEIALLSGAMLAAAKAGMVLVIDGFIVTSALLVAARIAPEILDYCVFSHCSNEVGHRLQLAWLKGEALLDLGLALGRRHGCGLGFAVT